MRINYSLKHCTEQTGESIGGADNIPDGGIVIFSSLKENIGIRVGDDILYWYVGPGQSKVIYSVEAWKSSEHETFPKGAIITFTQD